MEFRGLPESVKEDGPTPFECILSVDFLGPGKMELAEGSPDSRVSTSTDISSTTQ
jgi:hypothetical protein